MNIATLLAAVVLSMILGLVAAQTSGVTVPCPEGGSDPCEPHGRCVVDGFCVCDASATEGHWAGDFCDVCADGWAGQDCTAACNGGSCTPCNLHGTCSQGKNGDGSCTCFQDQVRGFWAGAACAQCSPSYYGFYCNQTCPGIDRSRGWSCFGHGVCSQDVTGTGRCTCDPGFSSESNCADCDAAHYGPGCASECEGYVSEGPNRGRPCSGHGTCASGLSGDGRCTCDSQWGRLDCSVACPNNCSYPFGICLDGSDQQATCHCDEVHAPDDCSTCIANKTGPGCSEDCPMVGSRICGDRGNCTFNELTQRSECICVDGYLGAVCDVECPGDPPCSAHGRCSLANSSSPTPGAPVCECYADDERGYWYGANCSVCHPAFGTSTTCMRRCPVGSNGEICSGHGTCLEGECFCERFTSAGFDYCGSACEVATIPGIVDRESGQCIGCTCVYCATGSLFGPRCEQRCPGYARLQDERVQSCSSNGFCREGVAAAGTCGCKSGWAGARCSLRCPVNPETGLVCSGVARGVCAAVQITPATNFTAFGGRSAAEPSLIALCECRPRFGGSTCELSCPIVSGLVCSGHGVCNRSYDGDATCTCDAKWAGRACNVPCGCFSENGRCDPLACADLDVTQTCSVCRCFGNFTGLCDVCRSGTQGPRCEGACVNGTTVGRTCQCFTNFSTASCDVPCPTSGSSSDVCSGHGQCSWGDKQAGVCECFPLDNPVYFGTACEVFCTPTLCRQTRGILNAQCNPASGECECLDSDDGHWSGPACDTCASGYWGPTCTTRCECSARGSCDMDSGDCACFDDDALGHFSGRICATCAPGFIGQDCRERNAQPARLDRPVSTKSSLILPADAQPSSAAPQRPAPRMLLMDENRLNLYAGGVPIFKLGVSTDRLSQELSNVDAIVRSAESFGCSLDPGEAAYAWASGQSVFFLMQPSPLCRRGLRVIQVDREDRDTGFVTTKQLGDQDWLTNLTVRVVAAAAHTGDTSTNAQYPLILAVALAQFSGPGGSGTQLPGGFLLLIDIDGMQSGNGLSFMSQLTLPRDFIARDLAYSPTFSGAGAIAVVGQRIIVPPEDANDDGPPPAPTYVWDVLLLRRVVDSFGPAFGGVNATMDNTQHGSIRSTSALVLPCWAVPSLEGDATTEGAVTMRISAVAECEDCVEVARVVFAHDSIVVAIHKTPPASPIIAWLRPIEQVTNGEILVVPFKTVVAVPGLGSITRDECRLATAIFDSVLGRLVARDATTGVVQELRLGTLIARTASVDNLETAVTAVAFDSEANISYVALQSLKAGRASSLVKVSITTRRLSLFGQVSLGYVTAAGTSTSIPEVISAMTIDFSRRMVYAMLTGIPQLRLAAFLMVEVNSLSPIIADQRGGTVIDVTGAGFKTVMNVTDPTNPVPYAVMCKFGEVHFVEAVSYNFTNVRCIAPAVEQDEAAESCVGQPVEVSLFGVVDAGLVGWTTINGVTTRRLQVPKIGRVDPRRGSVNGGTVVTLGGEGFVNSTVAVCRFWSSNPDPRNEEVLLSPVIFISDREVRCVQPRASNASFVPGLVDVATDGQIYCDPALYDIVGNATGVESPAEITIRASELTDFSLSVHIIDEQQHRLLTIDAGVSRRINLTVVENLTDCNPVNFRWFGNQTVRFGYPQDPCRPNVVNVTSLLWLRNTSNGLVTYDDLNVRRPRIATMSLIVTDIDRGWTSTTTLNVVEGDAHALFLSNYEWYLGRGGTVVPHRFENEKALSPEPEVMVVDALANRMRTISAVVVEARPFYINDTDNSIVTSQTSFVQAQRSAGQAIVFAEITLPFLHGASHYVRFTSTSHASLRPIDTPTLRTADCDGRDAFYKVPNTGICRECPGDGAICDGSEVIVVRPTYWRASENLTFIYRCEQNPANCFGEPKNESDYSSICEVGYEGPLCTVCSAGFGKSAGRTCARCASHGDQIRDVVLIGLAGVLGQLVWTIVVMRDAELTDFTIVLRTVVNHLQATGSIGEFSNRWNPFLKNMYEVQGEGSSLSLSGLSSLDCLIRGGGFGYDAIFAMYMMLPAVSIALSIFVYIVVRIAGLKPAITEKLRFQLLEETHDSPDAPNAVILHRYPFLYVLVPTVSIFMFSVYQTLLTESTSVLRCLPLVIDSSGVARFFMQADMSMECTSSGDHHFRSAAMVCAFVYGAGVPLLFVASYRVIITRSGKRELANVMFLFMVGGYKAKYWFWQAIIMIRKMALVGIIVFVEDNKELQSYAAVWTMSIALILQIWFNPNEKEANNQVEALSLAMLAMTMNLGLLYQWPALPDFAANILTATLILLNLGAAAMFLYFIVMSVLPDIKGAVAGLREKVKDWREGKSTEKTQVKQRIRINLHLDDDDDNDDLDAPATTVEAQDARIGVNVAAMSRMAANAANGSGGGGSGGAGPGAQKPTITFSGRRGGGRFYDNDEELDFAEFDDTAATARQFELRSASSPLPAFSVDVAPSPQPIRHRQYLSAASVFDDDDL